MTHATILAMMGVAALGTWAVAIWRVRHCLWTPAPCLPPEMRDSLAITVLVLISIGTLAAWTDEALSRDVGDALRAAYRATALVSGIYALLATR